MRSEARGEPSRQRSRLAANSDELADRLGSTAAAARRRDGGSARIRDATAARRDQQPRPTRRTAQRVPGGQEIDVRLERELSSDTAQVEDRFEATTVVDLYQGNAC